MATKRKGPKDWKWVGVYLVTREYGGPEEGGWWYDQYQHVASVRLWRPIRAVRQAYAHGWRWEWVHNATEQQLRFRDSVEQRFSHMTYLPGGSLGSVLGGEEIRVTFEEVAGEREDMGRPHYE